MFFSHLTLKTVWYTTNKEMKIFKKKKKGNGDSEMSSCKSSLYIQVK